MHRKRSRKKAFTEDVADEQISLAEFAAKAAKKCKLFSAGACTWQKILLRLQVWNLSLKRGQIMRAADCKNCGESPKGFSRKQKKASSEEEAFYRCRN